jgi:hypothetical protein
MGKTLWGLRDYGVKFIAERKEARGFGQVFRKILGVSLKSKDVNLQYNNWLCVVVISYGIWLEFCDSAMTTGPNIVYFKDN